MEDIKQNSAAEDWAEIEALFSTRRAMLPNKAWWNWISTRAGAGRLSRMMSNAGAGPLAAKLDQMDDERVKALRTFAAVNLEQAAQGFRVTLVANVTAPVLLITVMNSFTSDGLGGFLLSSYGDGAKGLLVGLVFATFFLAIMIAYALASLNQARDIRHLIDLFGAERGIYFGLEDTDDMHAA